MSRKTRAEIHNVLCDPRTPSLLLKFRTTLMLSVCARVFVAQSPAPIVLPLSSRLSANLAGVERFLYCGFDALADGVTFVIHGEAQAAELLFHLQHFELASDFLL